MKARTLTDIWARWAQRVIPAGEVVEVPDYREEACAFLRDGVKGGNVEILEPQKRPDYAKAREEARK